MLVVPSGGNRMHKGNSEAEQLAQRAATLTSLQARICNRAQRLVMESNTRALHPTARKRCFLLALLARTGAYAVRDHIRHDVMVLHCS